MTEPPVSPGKTSTVPPPSPNGSTPQAAQPTPGTAPASSPPTSQAAAKPRSGRRLLHTRISGVHTALIAGIAGLIVVLIFIIQNDHPVDISFLGAHLRLSLAIALFLAAIAGALLMAAAGTARITQLRRIMRRNRSNPSSG